MLRGKVRSLCAKIAIEINADKVDALIADLTQLLVGEYMNTRPKAEEVQRKYEQIQRDTEKKPATASRIDKDSGEKVS
jgi:RNA processing factor Prp31